MAISSEPSKKVKFKRLDPIDLSEVRTLWWHQGVLQYVCDYTRRMQHPDTRHIPSALGGVVTHNLLWLLYLTNLQLALGHERTAAYPITQRRLAQLLSEAVTEHQQITNRELDLDTVTELYFLHGDCPTRFGELRRRIESFSQPQSVN